MNRILAVVLATATVAAPFCMSGCASLGETTHDVEHAANVVDEGAQKLEAIISSVRVSVQPYAALAVSLCEKSPVDPDACASLDAGAQELFRGLDTAKAALDLYNAGKGDFVDAYDAVVTAVDSAKSYVEKVLALARKAQA